MQANKTVTLNIDGKDYPSLLVITAKGYGKHSHLGQYRQTARSASGVKTLNLTNKTGQPVLIQTLTGEEEGLIVTTKNGVTIRLDINSIPQLGRSTQGVRVIKLDKGDSVISGSVI